MHYAGSLPLHTSFLDSSCATYLYDSNLKGSRSNLFAFEKVVTSLDIGLILNGSRGRRTLRTQLNGVQYLWTPPTIHEYLFFPLLSSFGCKVGAACRGFRGDKWYRISILTRSCPHSVTLYLIRLETSLQTFAWYNFGGFIDSEV